MVCCWGDALVCLGIIRPHDSGGRSAQAIGLLPGLSPEIERGNGPREPPPREAQGGVGPQPQGCSLESILPLKPPPPLTTRIWVPFLPGEHPHTFYFLSLLSLFLASVDFHPTTSLRTVASCCGCWRLCFCGAVRPLRTPQHLAFAPTSLGASSRLGRPPSHRDAGPVYR